MTTDRTQSQWIIEKREATAEHGMVAAMHPLAAAAGLDVLEAGGNAVDAAVAAGFAIGVVEPAMSGIGGVAAMVVYSADTESTVVVDGSSAAPAGVSPDTFELDGQATSGGMYGWRGTVGDAQNTGYGAPIVPGQPACLLHALERFGSGRLSRQRVLARAVQLAEEGFAVDTHLAQTIAFAQRRLRPYDEAMRIFFLDDGSPPTPASSTKAADHLIQADLAGTLRALADHGSGALYQGEIGDRLVADLQVHGGFISRDDLAGYRVREYGPGLRATYRGYELVGLSPTSGSMTAFEALNILGTFDLSRHESDAPVVRHLVAEALRRAFVDRFAYLADPTHEAVPVVGLLSSAYAAEVAQRIRPDRAEPEARPGDPWRFEPVPASARRQTGGAPGGDGCTTHLTVVDKDRNVVSLTSTLGAAFGSGVVGRGTGILLNNGMTWFDPEPGHANSIAAGKRTLWAPTPTIMFRGGRPVLGIGAPGGRRIISAIVQSIVNVVDFGMGIQEAVTTPRVHCEGPVTEVDDRLAPGALAGLADIGHRVQAVHEDSSSFCFARPGGIWIDPNTPGRLIGGVHQLTPAWAMGY